MLLLWWASFTFLSLFLLTGSLRCPGSCLMKPSMDSGQESLLVVFLSQHIYPWSCELWNWFWYWRWRTLLDVWSKCLKNRSRSLHTFEDKSQWHTLKVSGVVQIPPISILPSAYSKISHLLSTVPGSFLKCKEESMGSWFTFPWHWTMRSLVIRSKVQIESR